MDAKQYALNKFPESWIPCGDKNGLKMDVNIGRRKMAEDIYDEVSKDQSQKIAELEGANTALQLQNQKLIEQLNDFKVFGTRHDTNPTGKFMPCGHFESFNDDSWQGYIKSQDESVRTRAAACLKAVGVNTQLKDPVKETLNWHNEARGKK